MKTAILRVQSMDKSLAGFARAWESGVVQTAATIAFATPELMRAILTPERCHIVKMLCGAGQVSIRDIARSVDRDMGSVDTDIVALLSSGVLERRGNGVIFPYDDVSIDLPTIGRHTVASSKT
ncbi:putative transcriptional regulator [Duganella sp. 1411]|uniref:HVO_A0114 family putative DNA-binding protein n=1 Tax=Duganella sp. 1411 TaxID=2806572 RepID=UPI001B47D9F9|nr:DNA-binding protein [Duganella sp. 1411]MBP1204121.1 putative transcriptional regulator [Duganella sp. 1411]